MISFATVAFKAGAGTGTLDIALRAHCHFLRLLCRPNLNPKLSLFLMFIGILCIHSLLNFLGYLLLECSNSKWDMALRAHCHLPGLLYYARLTRPCPLAWRHCHLSTARAGPWAMANKAGQRCHPSASKFTLRGQTNMKIVQFALFANFLSHAVEHMASQGWVHMGQHGIKWDGWMERGRQPQTGFCQL